ncbi:hypothetical protein GCM10020331_030870 [Ectobacillus funiculus]
MGPTTVSQIIEQIIRIVILLGGSFVVIKIFARYCRYCHWCVDVRCLYFSAWGTWRIASVLEEAKAALRPIAGISDSAAV